MPVPAFLWKDLDDWAWRQGIDPSGWPTWQEEADPERLLFPGRDGGYLTNFEYRRMFDPAAKDIGMEGLVPHELRTPALHWPSRRVPTFLPCNAFWATTRPL